MRRKKTLDNPSAREDNSVSERYLDSEVNLGVDVEPIVVKEEEREVLSPIVVVDRDEIPTIGSIVN